MGKARIKATFIAACIVAVVLGSAASALAGAGGYSVRPGEIDPKDPATRAYFKPVLNPGATATHHIVVTNLGSAPLHLLIDPVDGLTGQTSGSVYANRQDPIVKAGKWLVPSTHDLTLGAGQSRSVAFTISVPRDATPGDHLAGIAFENTATNSSSGSFAVKQIIREVIGVLVRVPGPASPRLTVGALALQSLPGTSFASVIVNLTNAGQLLCKPVLSVALHGPNGIARTVTRPLDTILPGDTIAYPLPWPDSLVKGTYTAHASTAACGPAASTADVPLTLGAPLNGSEPSTQPARVVHGPSMSLLMTVALALGALLFGLLIGKRRRRPAEPPSPIPTPAFRVLQPEPGAPIPSLRRFAVLEERSPGLHQGTRETDAADLKAPEQPSLWS